MGAGGGANEVVEVTSDIEDEPAEVKMGSG